MKIDRVLVVDPNTANAKMLADFIKSLRPGYRIAVANDAPRAWALAKRDDPQAIFLEAKAPTFDGLAFCRELRRSDLTCRAVPVIVASAEITASMVHGARDAGVHELLRRPFTMGDLLKRINAVSGEARDWIASGDYVGPDRRRFNAAGYEDGKDRRRS